MFVSVSILKTQVESIRGISDKSMDNPPDWPLIDQSASSSTDHGKDESQELFHWKILSMLTLKIEQICWIMAGTSTLKELSLWECSKFMKYSVLHVFYNYRFTGV